MRPDAQSLFAGPALRAVAERRAASRTRLFRALQPAPCRRDRRTPAAAHRRPRPRRAASRPSRRRFSTTSTGSAFASSGPPRRQSEHADDYAAALRRLEARGLVYPCFCSRARSRARRRARSRRRAALSRRLPRLAARGERERALARGDKAAWRLDMGRAIALAPAPARLARISARATWQPSVAADPAAWGDVVLQRPRPRRELSSGGDGRRRACRASPTSCAAGISSPRPPFIACCRRCSACPRRAIVTTASCSTPDGGKMSKSRGSPTLAACGRRRDGGRRSRSAGLRGARRPAFAWRSLMRLS